MDCDFELVINDERALVHVSAGVTAHMNQHLQRHFWSCEAGGQLFGNVSESGLEISKVTGPYKSDWRTPLGYRSDPRVAQRAIVQMHKLGLTYLGEWHTHRQEIPRPSSVDWETISRTAQKSELRSGAILLLVRGFGALPEGLFGCAAFPDGRLVELRRPELPP